MTRDAATEKYKKYEKLDPFPEIQPALLNSADVHDYINAIGMIWPYDENQLNGVTLSLRVGDVAVYWNEKNLPRIVTYCQKDVLTIAQIFLRFRGETLLMENEVEIVEDQRIANCENRENEVAKKSVKSKPAKSKPANSKPSENRNYGDILYEVRDQVAWITINRPRVMNAFREQTLDEMIHAVKSTREDP